MSWNWSTDRDLKKTIKLETDQIDQTDQTDQHYMC